MDGDDKGEDEAGIAKLAVGEVEEGEKGGGWFPMPAPLGRDDGIPCICIGPGEPLRDGGREFIRLGVDAPEPEPTVPAGSEPFPFPKLC